MPRDLNEIRDAAKAHLRRLTRRGFAQCVGEVSGDGDGDSNDGAAAPSWLHESSTLDLIDKASRQSDDPIRARALGRLGAFLRQGRLWRRTAPLDERLRGLFSERRIQVRDRDISFYALGEFLAVEPEAQRRAAAVAGALPILEEAEPILLERLEAQRRETAEWGGDLRSFGEGLRETSYDALAEVAREFLDATAALTDQLLDLAASERLDAGREALRRSDLHWVLRDPAADAAFDGTTVRRMGERVVALFSRDDRPASILTLPPTSGPGRALCFPIEVPGDVRIVHSSRHGLADARGLLHELGHGMHFAQTQEATWELARLGSLAGSEMSAFVFDALTRNRRFLRDVAGLDDAAAERVAAASRLETLHTIRRYAAKFLYEMEREARPDRAREIYRIRLSEAYRFELTEADAARYLEDVDELFYAADYLNGWRMAAALEGTLVERWGEGWFANEGAVEHLRGLWAMGLGPTPEEWFERLGVDGEGTSPLVRVVAESGV